MHVDLLHPTRFLKSGEFKGRDVTFTIADVQLEELEREDNSKERKGIVAFRETEKLLVLNKTNSKCLSAMFGVETESWKGKRATFFPFPMKDPFTKEDITGIRVRGSPDITAPVSVSIKLRKKKAQTMTMQKTGGAPVPLAGDELAAELDAISKLIAATEATPAACDAAWTAGLGRRINALPPPEKATKTEEFKARKRGAPVPPPASEPPGDAQPDAAPPA